MGDSDLDAIRKQRLAELQAQYGGNNQSGNDKEKQAQAAQAAAERKELILNQILTQSARARLNTLILGKPEKGKMVEEMLLRQAQYSQAMHRMDEDDLIKLLDSVSSQIKSKEPTIKFDRRRAALDSDDDDL